MRFLARAIALPLLLALLLAGACGPTTRPVRVLGVGAAAPSAGPLLQPVAITDAGETASVDAAAEPDAAPAIATAPLREDAGTGASSCPPEMVLVDGMYCPQVEQVCLRWMDGGEFWGYRCAEYKNPSRCLSGKMHLRFCIDREEYVKPGEPLPENGQSWTMSEETCAARSARNCWEREWQFACEGEDMHPYPYGDGFVRDATACNIDRAPVADGKRLLDLRAPVTDYPRCVSPFGVHDMSGNVEEWATKDNPPQPPPMRATMKGAWWLPGKNTCRAATVDHDEQYRGTQTGIRCCKDAP